MRADQELATVQVSISCCVLDPCTQGEGERSIRPGSSRPVATWPLENAMRQRLVNYPAAVVLLLLLLINLLCVLLSQVIILWEWKVSC